MKFFFKNSALALACGLGLSRASATIFFFFFLDDYAYWALQWLGKYPVSASFSEACVRRKSWLLLAQVEVQVAHSGTLIPFSQTRQFFLPEHQEVRLYTVQAANGHLNFSMMLLQLPIFLYYQLQFYQITLKNVSLLSTIC